MSDINSMQRNDRGLLEGVEYIFNEKGLIDWRKMLDNKWLYPNPSKKLNFVAVRTGVDFEEVVGQF